MISYISKKRSLNKLFEHGQECSLLTLFLWYFRDMLVYINSLLNNERLAGIVYRKGREISHS
jgi:hypothetical protein